MGNALSDKENRQLEPMRLLSTWCPSDSETADWTVQPYGPADLDGGRMPLVCLVHPTSGGRAGATLLPRLRTWLSPWQVFSLTDPGGPRAALQHFVVGSENRFVPIRIMVCGGDGAVGWVLSTLDSFEGITHRPAVGTLPLGTGNDLARTLGWGSGYVDATDSLVNFLREVHRAQEIAMDRWKVRIREDSPEGEEGAASPEADVGKETVRILNNYFSVGVDAEVALEFHEERVAHPERFTSRVGNKAIYVRLGIRKILQVVALHEKLRTFAPGGKAREVNRKWEGLIWTNISNYSAGNNFWGTLGLQSQGFKELDLSDGLLEVMAVDGGGHMAILQSDLLHAQRVAQCSMSLFRVVQPVAMQMDGEPWRQGPCTVVIEHHNRVPMLRHRKATVESSATLESNPSVTTSSSLLGATSQGAVAPEPSASSPVVEPAEQTGSLPQAAEPQTLPTPSSPESTPTEPVVDSVPSFPPVDPEEVVQEQTTLPVNASSGSGEERVPCSPPEDNSEQLPNAIEGTEDSSPPVDVESVAVETGEGDVVTSPSPVGESTKDVIPEPDACAEAGDAAAGGDTVDPAAAPGPEIPSSAETPTQSAAKRTETIASTPADPDQSTRTPED